jgi:hypothetical protein
LFIGLFPVASAVVYILPAAGCEVNVIYHWESMNGKATTRLARWACSGFSLIFLRRDNEGFSGKKMFQV